MGFSFNDVYYKMTGKKLKLTKIDFYKEFLFHHNLNMYSISDVSQKINLNFLNRFLKLGYFVYVENAD